MRACVLCACCVRVRVCCVRVRVCCVHACVCVCVRVCVCRRLSPHIPDFSEVGAYSRSISASIYQKVRAPISSLLKTLAEPSHAQIEPHLKCHNGTTMRCGIPCGVGRLVAWGFSAKPQRDSQPSPRGSLACVSIVVLLSVRACVRA